MSSAVPLREDFTVSELRAVAGKGWDARRCARLLALAGAAKGRSRLEVARLGGMDRQTLRRWVHRFNQAGPEGLLDRKSPDASPKVSAEQKAEWAESGAERDRRARCLRHRPAVVYAGDGE